MLALGNIGIHFAAIHLVSPGRMREHIRIWFKAE